MQEQLTEIKPIRWRKSQIAWLDARADMLGTSRSAILRALVERERGNQRWEEEIKSSEGSNDGN